MRLFSRECPPEVMNALIALRPRPGTSAYRTWDDMMLYARVGRDRRKLDMDWVERTRRLIAKCGAMDVLLEEMIAGAADTTEVSSEENTP